jgi:hypothetical protein
VREVRAVTDTESVKGLLYVAVQGPGLLSTSASPRAQHVVLWPGLNEHLLDGSSSTTESTTQAMLLHIPPE